MNVPVEGSYRLCAIEGTPRIGVVTRNEDLAVQEQGLGVRPTPGVRVPIDGEPPQASSKAERSSARIVEFRGLCAEDEYLAVWKQNG